MGDVIDDVPSYCSMTEHKCVIVGIVLLQANWLRLGVHGVEA
ncbi:hypothetical protein RchiOBHm_Chr5g0076501 [Rosa chinensis]|uniref:Uncharacterized protein n=1 Tax=Rosa chinensis TaxID=74649 RepID=A0A2P6QLQ4_ROSCH|nr:hypothetical protein RchiOBHm_Chr5g0076501 [Rosa chinensis]